MGGNTIGIVMNGVTGRMGLNQHLVRSIVAIRAQGGVPMPDGTRLMPDPILVGRDERKLRALAETVRDRAILDGPRECSRQSPPTDLLRRDADAACAPRTCGAPSSTGSTSTARSRSSVSTDEALDLARLADRRA